MRRRWWHSTPVLLPGKSHGWRSLVGCSRTWLSNFTFSFHFHALEKEMATHSNVSAWRIPGTGEPGGLLSMGSHRVGHDWSDLAAAAAAICDPWAPQSFLPSQSPPTLQRTGQVVLFMPCLFYKLSLSFRMPWLVTILVVFFSKINFVFNKVIHIHRFLKIK